MYVTRQHMFIMVVVRRVTVLTKANDVPHTPRFWMVLANRNKIAGRWEQNMSSKLIKFKEEVRCRDI